MTRTMKMAPRAGHPLASLGFELLAAAQGRATHPLAGFGFAPASVTICNGAADRAAVQPTGDPAANQALATAAMPQYTEALKAVTAKVPGARLAATRPAKKPQRLAEKIALEGQPPATVTDYGAAQIAVDSPQAKEAVVQAVEQRFPVLLEKDHFQDGDPVYRYRSDTLQVKMPNGSSEELQIVPREVLAANPEEHHAYKEAREATLAGESSSQARGMARAMNDAAMEGFHSRNEAAQPNRVVKGSVVKGARVRLADGAVARVLYVDPAMRIVRVRTEDGRNLTVRRKDLE